MLEARFGEIDKAIGIVIENRELLEMAFVHSTYAHEHLGVSSNERLEFLGDAVIGLAVAEYYFKKLPGQEGDLTDHRKTNVSYEALPIAARRLKLDEFLILGRGAEQQGLRKADKPMEDCFEALLGAIFLQFDYNIAYNFVINHLIQA